MITTIEQLTAKVGGEYSGLTKSGHLFKKTYNHPTKGAYLSYQYFIEGKCSLCGEPHFRSKWIKASSHVECACRETVKTRRKRCDRK